MTDLWVCVSRGEYFRGILGWGLALDVLKGTGPAHLRNHPRWGTWRGGRVDSIRAASGTPVLFFTKAEAALVILGHGGSAYRFVRKAYRDITGDVRDLLSPQDRRVGVWQKAV